MEKERKTFCPECREETTYKIKHVPCIKRIRDKDYEFEVAQAVCEHCGEPVNLPGLMDYNAQLIDKQYREKENLVTIEDIKNLMKLYHLGKAPLSISLGFGEITITRYLTGQVPSKEYSDLIRQALQRPGFMKKKIKENAEKLGNTAYKKAVNAAEELQPLFSLSEKMRLTISYLFEKAEEVTPLALQKMLYFIEGIYMARFGTKLFDEECLAWTHGPVYREVYDVFKGFKYNPIDDSRFATLKNRFNELSDAEREVVDLVVESFGMYSGKTLEKLTHKEKPWIDAYNEYLSVYYPNTVIPKDSIKDYFVTVSSQYKLDNADDIKKYIHDQLRKEQSNGKNQKKSN